MRNRFWIFLVLESHRIMFDAQRFLEDEFIEYHTSGKNVQKGWIGIKCPFCLDTSNHCGINPEWETFKCWICKESGYVVKLVRQIRACSWEEAKTLTARYTSDNDVRMPLYLNGDNNSPKTVTCTFLPTETLKHFPEPHREYLISRNFDPDKLIRKYELKATGPFGDYRMRIIIPILVKSKLVSFTARDITDNAEIRYKDCEIDKSVIPVKNCLYNIDRVRTRKVLIVEGATDVWRIGDGAVATMTTEFTERQVLLLSELGVETVFTMFDAGYEAQKRAKELLAMLPPKIRNRENIALSEGDPAELSEEDVKYLRKDIGL